MHWKQLWNGWVRILKPSSDPSVTQKRDRSGHQSFEVYDPMTQKYGEFGSELEIRAWLEQRYYRS
jgi:hypothetical protein